MLVRRRDIHHIHQGGGGRLSIPRDHRAPDGNDGRVFLGPEGDLSRNDQHYGMDDENYSRRRMMNQYRRAFKRPCILVGAVLGIVAIAYGAR